MNTINGWKNTSFGEIATLVKGVSYASEDYCGPDQGAIFLTIKCVSKAGGFKPEGIKYFKGKVADSQELHAGDLLIANTDLTRAGDIVGAPIVVPSLNGETITMSMDLSKVVEDDRKIDRQFLYFMLMTDSVRRFMKDHSSGSTVLHLQTRAVPMLEIGIPNKKSEQAKIAEILSTVDQAIEQTEALIAKQQRVKTGLMQDLLTRGIDEHGNLRSEQTHQFKDSPLGRIPVEWEVKELNDLVDEPITYGIVQAGPHIENGIPYIRTGDMAAETIQVSQLLRTSPKIAKSYKRSSIYPGDIIFALRATVGKVLPVIEELSGANLTQGTAKISPRDSVDSTFLLWAMRTYQVQNAIRLEQKGTTFMEITLGDLRRITLALPKDKHEQIVIGGRLELHERLRRDFLEHKRKLQSIKTALMQDLLTGERRVTKL